ncbi:hypothetical protein VTL71DRAFT_15513 [Oculimacula yallundae]|uniref:V-SNARE coiled-coil homology domain-containing protein n=1 Tax=Oculimacula yallundae TaxID=86028 RepID=A0ABR4CHF0_9HELO
MNSETIIQVEGIDQLSNVHSWSQDQPGHSPFELSAQTPRSQTITSSQPHHTSVPQQQLPNFQRTQQSTHSRSRYRILLQIPHKQITQSQWLLQETAHTTHISQLSQRLDLKVEMLLQATKERRRCKQTTEKNDRRTTENLRIHRDQNSCRQIDDTVGVMRENINKVSQRGERLDSLQDKTDNLAVSAQGFRRGANRVRKQMWWKGTRHEDENVLDRRNNHPAHCYYCTSCCCYQEELNLHTHLRWWLGGFSTEGKAHECFPLHKVL